MDPPLADVVSFSEKARTLRGDGAGAAGDGAADAAAARAAGEGAADAAAASEQEPGSSGPADLAREAIFRRLGQLVQPGADAGMRSVDDELAVLVYDSATDPAPLAGIRGSSTATTRQLRFQSPHLVLEVQLEGPVRELTCQVVPSQRASLEVRHEGGTLQLGVDDFGTFHAAELPDGAVSLRCVSLDGDAGATATSWITVSDHLSS